LAIRVRLSDSEAENNFQKKEKKSLLSGIEIAVGEKYEKIDI